MPIATFYAPDIAMIVWLFVVLASLVLFVWSLIEIATKDFHRHKDKVTWLIIVLLFGGIGSLIYLTQRKKLLVGEQSADEYDTFDLDARRPLREKQNGRSWNEDELV